MPKKNPRCFRFSNPSTPEELEQAYKDGMIRKSDLKVGHFYYGHCRNADYAMWLGTEFVHDRYKFGTVFLETINHPEDDNGYDFFTPQAEVDENDEELERLKGLIKRDEDYNAKLDSKE